MVIVGGLCKNKYYRKIENETVNEHKIGRKKKQVSIFDCDKKYIYIYLDQFC